MAVDYTLHCNWEIDNIDYVLYSIFESESLPRTVNVTFCCKSLRLEMPCAVHCCKLLLSLGALSRSFSSLQVAQAARAKLDHGHERRLESTQHPASSRHKRHTALHEVNANAQTVSFPSCIILFPFWRLKERFSSHAHVIPALFYFSPKNDFCRWGHSGDELKLKQCLDLGCFGCQNAHCTGLVLSNFGFEDLYNMSYVIVSNKSFFAYVMGYWPLTSTKFGADLPIGQNEMTQNSAGSSFL